MVAFSATVVKNDKFNDSFVTSDPPLQHAKMIMNWPFLCHVAIITDSKNVKRIKIFCKKPMKTKRNEKCGRLSIATLLVMSSLCPVFYESQIWN